MAFPRIGAFPISIDYNAFARQAAQPEIKQLAAQLHEKLPNRKLVLGVDRLDYTKGIPHRLKAFSSALQRYPELRERMSLIQVVVPSRVDIADYHDLKLEIEQLVGQINGEFVRRQHGGERPRTGVPHRVIDPNAFAIHEVPAEIGGATGDRKAQERQPPGMLDDAVELVSVRLPDGDGQLTPPARPA